MRTLKFRAWGFGKMFPVRTLEHLCTCMPRYNLKGLTLMQFTGLHDKNGKEIYERDILKEQKWRGHIVYSVEWEDGGDDSYIWHGYTFDERLVEVIGNIYENPNLLKDLMGG